MVHRVRVDTKNTGESVLRTLHGDAATKGARRAGTFNLFEVPRARRESIGLGGQCSDGANLHRVAREHRVKRLRGERCDFNLVAASREINLRVARNFRGESGAATALNAALAIEKDELANRDRLFEVTLLLDETGLTRAVRQHLVLERAFATLVTHRAVERVVRQQELKDTILGLLDLFALGVDHHAVSNLDVARGGQRGASGAIHFH